MPRVLALVLLGAAAAGCGGSGWPGGAGSSDRSAQTPLATRTSAPIAFLLGEPPRELGAVTLDGSETTIARAADRDELTRFSWFPDGRRITFSAADAESAYDHIYVVNADGTRLRKVMRSPGGRAFAGTEVFAGPAASPDGAALAFATHDDGDHGIWRVDVDGSDARPLTAVRTFSQPSWSPEGMKIVYADLGHGGGIYVMNADGSSKRRIARTSTVGASLRDLDGTVDGPQLSPSGDRIAFFRGGELWIVGADGGGERRVGGIDGLRDPLFRWSPDGKSIAFTGQIEGLDTELAVASVDRGGVRRLTDNDVQEKFPSWSPDGKALAFVRYAPGFGSGSSVPGAGDVYVMNADGTGERNLTDSLADETLPLWSP